MNFIKLKNQFVFDSADVIEKQEIANIGGGALRNYTIDTNTPNIQKIYQVIPSHARQLFSISAVKISQLLAPHVDDVKTSILFYVQAGSFKTQFYKVASETPVINYSVIETNKQEINDLNSYRPETYRIEDLLEQDSYVAADFDAWCVDGSVPHAIMHYDQCNEVNRIFILYKTDLPFHTVLELLKQTNSI
jgi:hypothetical protein